MKSLKINYPLKDVTFEEKSSDFRPNADLPEFPYGLKICLNEETIAMLGLTKLPEIGSTLKMECLVKVCSRGEYTNDVEKKVYRNLDLQITDMEIETPKKSVDANKMYSSEEKKKEEIKETVHNV